MELGHPSRDSTTAGDASGSQRPAPNQTSAANNGVSSSTSAADPSQHPPRSDAKPPRPMPSLAERLGLGGGPGSAAARGDEAGAEPGSSSSLASAPAPPRQQAIAGSVSQSIAAMPPSRSAASPSKASSTSDEEGMIKEDDAESEEEGELDQDDAQQPHARSSSGHHSRSERSSPRPAGFNNEQNASSSSSSSTPTSRRWGNPATGMRNDSFAPPHPPLHTEKERDRDRQRERSGPSMWPPSRYDDVRPPLERDGYHRPEGTAPFRQHSASFRQRSVQEDRPSWPRPSERRSMSPDRRLDRDRRFERRQPSPTAPLSGPNSIGARPSLHSSHSYRDEGMERSSRLWGSGPASAGPPTRWNRWNGGRERERSEMEESRGGDPWHPPPRGTDDRAYRRGSERRTMDDGFVRSRTPSLQQSMRPDAAADAWRRSPELSRSETAQPFERSRSSTSNLGPPSSPPPPPPLPPVRAVSPGSARAARPNWGPGFEPPARDAGWGGKARRESQQTVQAAESQTAGDSASAGEPATAIESEAQDSMDHRRAEPQTEDSAASKEDGSAARPLASEDTGAVQDYVAAEVKELANQEMPEAASLPTPQPPPVDPLSLKQEIESAAPHPKEPLITPAADEESNAPPFSESAAPTLPAEAQMQAPAIAGEEMPATAPALAVVTEPAADATRVETPKEGPSTQLVSELATTSEAGRSMSKDVQMAGAEEAETKAAVPSAQQAEVAQVAKAADEGQEELDAVLKEAVAVAAASAEGKPEAEIEADIAGDVVMKTPESGENDGERGEDADSSPQPPQKTDEELAEAKRATILRLITNGKQPDSDVTIDKLMAVNQRMAEQTTNSLMESAVHGPPPPKLEVDIDVYEETEETQRMRAILTERIKASNKRLAAKTERLKSQYKALNTDWQAHCARLDRAAEARENARKAAAGTNTPQGAGGTFASGDDAGTPQHQQSASQSQPLMTPSIGGRSNRRGTQSGALGFGDAVRSEAEFLEILASLETADMQDPEARAARTATTVPDQLINPYRDALLKYEVDERNHFVANPVSYYLDEFDPDFWSAEEKAIFARKYALWPKQFGRIATALPNKTASQCVYYYYLTKHQPGHDYKAITAARNRNQKRKSRVMKPKKGRGSALMADLKSAKGDEAVGDDEAAGGDTPMSPMDERTRLMGDGGLLPPVEEEEGQAATGATTPGGSAARKVGEPSAKPKSGRGGKRVKGQSKAKASAAAIAAGELIDSQTIDTPSGAATPAEEASADSDLAAAEALGALSGMLPIPPASGKGAGGKKRKQLDPSASSPSGMAVGEDGAAQQPQRKQRPATSSYWSVQERGEFLRGIAIHGKDWKLVATRLNAKSAAQARNFFARNAELPDFVEAATFGEKQAEQPLSVREQMATEWARERLGLGAGVEGGQSQQTGSGASSARPGPSPVISKESSPELGGGMAPPPRRPGGMGIMSLLNDDRPSTASSSSSQERPPAPMARKPAMHEWFPSEHGSQPMSSSSAPSSDREGESTDSESFAFSSSARPSPATHHAYLSRPSYHQSQPQPPQQLHAGYEPRPYLPGARESGSAASSTTNAPPLPPSSLPSLPRLSTPSGLGSGSGLRTSYAGGGEYPATGNSSTARFARPPVYNSSSVREQLSPLLPERSPVEQRSSHDAGRGSMPPPSSLSSRPSYGSAHGLHAQQQPRHSSWSAGHPTVSGSSASPAPPPPLPPSSNYRDYGHSPSYGDRLAPPGSSHRSLAPPPPLPSRFSPGGGAGGLSPGAAAGANGSRSSSPGGSALPPYRGDSWSSSSRNVAPPSTAASSYHPYGSRPSSSPVGPGGGSDGRRLPPPPLPPMQQHPSPQHRPRSSQSHGSQGGEE